MQKKLLPILLISLIAAIMAACVSAPADEPANTGADTAEEEVAVEALRVALLPILDVLPFFVAEQNGYFIDAGIEVESVPVASAVERDQLMQAGEIDAMLNEMASSAVFNRDDIQVQVVMAAREATAEAPLFRVLAAPGSAVSSPSDLSGVPIGISQNTIIEYVTERLLEQEGVEDINGQSVPAIPERFQLLMEGQLEAATLPDPLAQSAIESGAVLVIDDSSYPQFAVSVLTFSSATIESNPEGVRRFLQAWNRAAVEINANPEEYRALLLERIQVPPNVQEDYEVPPFPEAKVPSEEQWNDVIEWLQEKGVLDAALPYADSVNADFLP
ncbi:MAG: ABC transporter substrate-binding protein [Chloroflexi bacterium]|nr:ABC transporter substrate-binding protein [Chloroflexota bacterium]